MSNVISACTTFFLYAVIAIFAQNAVLARGMGVSRVVQLVGDNDTSSLLFGLELSVICMLDAPLAWLLRRAVEQCSFRSLVRPLAYVLCSAVVCGVLWLVGVPLAFAGVYVLHIRSIAGLFALIQLEQLVRMGIGWGRYRQGKWCRNLTRETVKQG